MVVGRKIIPFQIRVVPRRREINEGDGLVESRRGEKNMQASLIDNGRTLLGDVQVIKSPLSSSGIYRCG